MREPTWYLAAAGAACTVLLLEAWRRRRSARCVRQPADDDEWVAFCHAQRRQRIERPSQSNFRVTAVVVFRQDGMVKHVVGHNDEACNLNNSVCAERAAFLQLAGIYAPLEVIDVFITTDAAHAITPGSLCREYMLSSRWTFPTTRVVAEGEAGPASRIEVTLAALVPFASIYTRLKRDDQMATGARLEPTLAEQRSAMGGLDGAVWRAAVAACGGDARDELHPIRFGAAVAFSDGYIASASHKKALEYGCSLDAIGQLAPAIEAHRATAPPVVICFADQFGVLHGPFAPARAYLSEFGHVACRVLVHDAGGGLHAPTVAELAPSGLAPRWATRSGSGLPCLPCRS